MANYLIVGPAMRLNDLVLENLLKQSNLAGLERVVLDLEMDSLDELIMTLSESSLFAEEKIVIIKNPTFLTGKKTIFKKNELLELEKIFGQINELEHHIFIKADYEKLDQRKKISKLITKQFKTIETTLKPFDLPKITQILVNENNLTIEPVATKLLIERSANNIDLLLANIDKLAVAVQGSVITKVEIETNIDRTLEENIFEIITNALEKKSSAALDQLDEQIEKGADPVQLTAVFSSQLSFLFQVKVLSKKMSEPELVKTMKAHPYRIKLAIEQKVSSQTLATLLQRLIELEYGYKSGKYQGTAMIKSLVLSI